MEVRDSEIVIVGGGLAGLACAVTLADRGIPVSLLESRPRLGGRASSFEDKQSQQLIDNCQHVSMGCCHEFNRFCETVGIADSFRTERELFFIGPDSPGPMTTETQFKLHRFAASSFLPAPFHLMPAFGALAYLSRLEKINLSRGLKALALTTENEASELTMAEWLETHGQNQNSIERFWKVVLVSALSERLDRISVAHARKVFVDGFLRARDNWQVLIPTEPLERLYGEVIRTRLQEKQAQVYLRTGVSRVELHEDRVTGIQLRDGTKIECGRVVIAVPHQRVLELLPDSFAGRDAIAGIAQLEGAPITSVHLWFDREITELPHAVFVDCLSQWMFNRTRIMGSSDENGFYYQIVISASHELTAGGRQGRTQEEIIDVVVQELARIWPEVNVAQLKHQRMVTEHQAVFSVTPGVERLRPAQQTRVSGLYLAGDWTSTGWPATMEGAVRSGLLAAEGVLSDLGRPESILLPPEKTSFLSKILFRL